MRWRQSRQSSNIEDRRGMGGRRALAGGGIGSIVIALIAMYFGVDPQIIGALTGSGGMSPGYVSQPSGNAPAADDPQTQFIAAVLGETEDTWQAIFAARGAQYAEPRLVLFSGSVQSACGFAQSAMGPFYCPADQKIYLDLSFFEDLAASYRAPGDFAQAYVVAHEVGHHIQTLSGVSGQVHAMQQQVSKAEANSLSVKLELQADCYAGVWAHHADRSRDILEEGDIREGLAAAAAVGDDRLQKQAQGYVVPESFTHGSSEQRMNWFKKGFADGTLEACDTFNRMGSRGTAGQSQMDELS